MMVSKITDLHFWVHPNVIFFFLDCFLGFHYLENTEFSEQTLGGYLVFCAMFLLLKELSLYFSFLKC